MGSAREARHWYYQSRPLLTEAVVGHQMALLTQIIRLLLVMIPTERKRRLAENPASYEISASLTDDPPMP